MNFEKIFNKVHLQESSSQFEEFCDHLDYFYDLGQSIYASNEMREKLSTVIDILEDIKSMLLEKEE